jgi:serine/threonine protein kinase
MDLLNTEAKSIIEFIRKKNYTRIRDIGQGGLGKTILLKDEIINELFVCKKYSPIYEEVIAQYFSYFIDEIKILHKLYHRNIVRIFNYYLYPESTTGYILMEYIQGASINAFLSENPDKLDDVFLQTVEGFMYLEEKRILHRDIRPDNILINEDGAVKIIDFGFGKFVNVALEDKSISLAWRYSVPSEFKKKVYDSRTEVYFVGRLFEEIIGNLGNVEFKYAALLKKMLCFEYDNRIVSFFDVYRETLIQSNSQNNFEYEEKIVYSKFANGISEVLSQISQPIKYHQDIPNIIRQMEDLYSKSMLEDNIQSVIN